MYIEPSAKDLRISDLESQLHQAKNKIRRLERRLNIKKRSGPIAYSQLTVAQRRNLKFLATLVGYEPLRARDKRSFDSLVKHDLAIIRQGMYAITAMGCKTLRQGGYDAERTSKK